MDASVTSKMMFIVLVYGIFIVSFYQEIYANAKCID